MGGICYQAHSNCSRLFPSLRTPSVMSKQAFAVRQGERELGCLWQMETIGVSLFHVSSGRNFSMLLSNRSKRCQRVRDEVSTVFIKFAVNVMLNLSLILRRSEVTRSHSLLSPSDIPHWRSCSWHHAPIKFLPIRAHVTLSPKSGI